MITFLKKIGKHQNFSIVFLALLIFLFLKPLFTPALQTIITPDFGQSDVFQLNVPAKFFLAESLKNNQLPLWNPYVGNGFPSLAEGQTGTFFILNLILFKFFPFELAFNLGIVSIFITTTVGMYFFCREIKLSHFGSFFSALTFTFSGVFVAHLTHFNLIQAASLFPLLLFLTLKIIKSRDTKKIFFWGGLFSLALSQQLFAGFPQIVLITIVWVFLLFFNKSLFTNNRLKLPLFFYLIFFVALGFLTASIQLIPQYEFLKISTRSKISETQASYYSYPFKHLVTLVLPYFLGNPKSGTYPPFYEFDGSVFWENTGYLGLIGIFFATLGLFSKFAYKKILLTSTLLSFLLMTGKFSPLYFVYEIPPFSFFRVPSRFILPFVFSLAILAGFFFQNLTSFFARIKIRNKLPLLTFISLLVIFLQFLDLKNFAWSYHAVAPWKDWLRKPATVEFINSQDGQKSSPKIISLFTSQPWNDVFTSKGWKSTEPYYYFRNDLMPNYNTLFNIKQFGVYPVQKTKRFDYFESLLLLGVKNDEKQIFISTTSAKLLGTAGVNYLIAPKYIITTENNQPIYKTTSKQNLPSYNVYSLKPTYSVYFTDSYLSASTLDEALNLLSSGKFNPPQNVILEKDFKLTQDNENHRPASISLIKTTNIDSTYDVKTDREGFLVLAQSFYPGWQVFVDGEVKEILPANLNFTAVFLTKGNHRVSFIYKPVSLRISLIFSLAGLVISFLMVLVVPLIYLRKSANNRSFSSRY